RAGRVDTPPVTWTSDLHGAPRAPTAVLRAACAPALPSVRDGHRRPDTLLAAAYARRTLPPPESLTGSIPVHNASPVALPAAAHAKRSRLFAARDVPRPGIVRRRAHRNVSAGR